MGYTFEPKHGHAKLSVRNARISTKSAEIVCAVIRRKPLKRAMRLLNDLDAKKRSLGGKYYSKAVREIKSLVESCEKNAEFLNLEKGRLFVHASASKGSSFHRRRRKAAFGSRMKTTSIEIQLIERGKEIRHVKEKKHEGNKEKTEHKEKNKTQKEPEKEEKNEKTGEEKTNDITAGVNP